MDVFPELHHSTVLVTGATGMIGSRTVRRLLDENRKADAGIAVVAHFRDAAKRDRVFADVLDDPAIRWLQADICRPLECPVPVHYVVHGAGVTGGSRKHVDFPVRTIQTALQGTTNLLELAREHAVRGFVYLSSLEVYGKTDFSLPAIRETDGGYIDPTAVRSSYSESKRMCETLCAGYAKQYGVPAKIVRLAPTYGLGADYGDNRVLCEFARCILEKRDIVLRSTGETVRNYCDVDDAAEAILLVLERGAVGEAYNIANPATAISVRDLAERFIALHPGSGAALKFDLSEDAAKLGYNKTIQIRLDSQKLEALGWAPRYGIDDLIGHLMDAMAASAAARGKGE